MDATPQLMRVLDGMPAREAAGFVRYFESIEVHPGDHPQSWSTMVPHIWATEFNGRTIRYRRKPGGGPVKVMSLF